MENVIFTQLSIPEVRAILRQELHSFFESKPPIDSKIEFDELLSIHQASEFLNLSVQTIYGLVSKAQVPVNKRGKRLYFSKQELTEWVKAGRKKTTTEIQAEAQTYIAKQKLR